MLWHMYLHCKDYSWSHHTAVSISIPRCPAMLCTAPPGLDLLWRIYLHCKDDNVASNYSEHMLHLYHSYEDICEETPSFRRALVK